MTILHDVPFFVHCKGGNLTLSIESWTWAQQPAPNGCLKHHFPADFRMLQEVDTYPSPHFLYSICAYEGSSPAARVENNSYGKQHRQFIVIVLTIFFAHPTPLHYAIVMSIFMSSASCANKRKCQPHTATGNGDTPSGGRTKTKTRSTPKREPPPAPQHNRPPRSHISTLGAAGASDSSTFCGCLFMLAEKFCKGRAVFRIFAHFLFLHDMPQHDHAAMMTSPVPKLVFSITNILRRGTLLHFSGVDPGYPQIHGI